MTKDEALKAMQDGEKVAHRYFSNDEWMKLTGSIYEFEDGCLCHIAEFWIHRINESWDEGWSIFSESLPSLLQKQAI